MVYATNKTPLYVYGALGVFVAIVCGVLAIYLAPVIGVLLRCASGGFAFAQGVSGLVGVSGGTLPPVWFYVIFAATGVAGAIWQLFYIKTYGKSEKAKGKMASTEKSSL